MNVDDHGASLWSLAHALHTHPDFDSAATAIVRLERHSIDWAKRAALLNDEELKTVIKNITHYINTRNRRDEEADEPLGEDFYFRMYYLWNEFDAYHEELRSRRKRRKPDTQVVLKKNTYGYVLPDGQRGYRLTDKIQEPTCKFIVTAEAETWRIDFACDIPEFVTKNDPDWGKEKMSILGRRIIDTVGYSMV
jgi:hypothetical protein